MAEPAVGGPAATDVFSLGGNYQPQTSNTDAKAVIAIALGATGDYVAGDSFGEMSDVVGVYKYTSDDPMHDQGANVTLPLPGELHNSLIVTNVSVAYSQTDWPIVTVTGHNHTDSAHDADLAVFTPTLTVAGGRGCPTLFSNSASATSAPTSETYTIGCEHVEADDGVGDHLAGATHDGKETYAGEFVGTPSLTTTNWRVSSTNSGDSNTGFDTTSIAAERSIVRT